MLRRHIAAQLCQVFLGQLECNLWLMQMSGGAGVWDNSDRGDSGGLGAAGGQRGRLVRLLGYGR